MAALASHHVRLALFPLRLDTDHTGYVDIPHSLGRRRLLLQDVHTIRATNNAIVNDIFWVHIAYVTADDGIARLRSLLRDRPDYSPVLAGFEAIDEGRRVLDDPGASAEQRRAAGERIWMGNVQLLEHEQRALVQPRFDHLSCAFARLISLGAASSFEVRGVRNELAYFTSFYLSSLTRGPAGRCAGAHVAQDHPVRRPLALDHHERGAAVPPLRRGHGAGRRQRAAHLRRRRRVRRVALRAARVHQASLVVSSPGGPAGVAAPPVRFRCPGAVSDRRSR